MEIDILDRLRDVNTNWCNPTVGEAIEEIERLRRQLKDIQEQCSGELGCAGYKSDTARVNREGPAK